MERLSTSRGEFEYETRGSGEPLVLIHGAISAEAFDCLLSESGLTNHYRLINYHRRGFLGSTPHAGPFSIAQQAQDALAVIAEVAGGRAHVAGHSYGGATLLQLALDAPDAVHTLSLLEPPLPVPSAEAFIGRLAALFPVYEAGDRVRAVDEFLDIVLGPGEYRAAVESHLPTGWHDRAVADIDTLYQVEFPALADWQFTADIARRITQPVLSVVGANSDQFFVECDALIRQWMPQAESFVLPNASHGLQFMNPRGMAGALVAFLAKHPMRVPATA